MYVHIYVHVYVHTYVHMYIHTVYIRITDCYHLFRVSKAHKEHLEMIQTSLEIL